MRFSIALFSLNNSLSEILTRDLKSGQKNELKGIIASGGVKNYLDGYYAVEKLQTSAVYGQASELLKMARISYEELKKYLEFQIEGYNLADQYLKIRKD